MSNLEHFLPQVQIIESKKKVKILAKVPVQADIIDKFVLQDVEPLRFGCGYVGECRDRFNWKCGFKGKWCNQQVKEATT